MWSTISLLFLLIGASSALQNDPLSIAKTFSDDMLKTVLTKDFGKISNLFADDFTFKACDFVINKTVTVAKLMRLHSNSKFLVESAQDTGATITYTMQVIGVVPMTKEFEFVLSKASNQLQRGTRLRNCAQRRRRSFDDDEDDEEKEEDESEIYKDGPHPFVAKFMDEFVSAIGRRNATAISNLLNEDFVFHGCKEKYNKENIADFLTNLPNQFYSFDLLSSTFVGTYDMILFTIRANEFAFPFKAHFMFATKNESLAVGYISACIEPVPPQNSSEPRRFISAPEDAHDVVQNFLDRITKPIESQDKTAISGFFQPGFVFKGCKGAYNKQKFVGQISRLPPRNKFRITVQSVQDLGASIKFKATAKGFYKTEIVAEFVLIKANQQLESGKILVCPKNKFHALLAEDAAQVTVEKFIARMIESIESKATSAIAGLFQHNFIFKGCKGVYDMSKSVVLLRLFPAELVKFSITLKFVQDLGASIKYQVSVSGFDKNDIIAEFILNKNDQQLESGNVPACQKSTLHALIAQDNAQTTVEKFVARIIRSIESKDVSIIAGLFQPGFVFKGCKGVYDKKKIVGLLSQLPAGTKFSITVKSVQDLGASIKYQVSASGFDKNEIIAEFVLNKNEQQLESGNIPACQKHTFHSLLDENPTKAKADKFSARMVKAIESRDKSAISALFQSGFVYKGCKGTYNKEQTIAFLMDIPAGTKLFYIIRDVVENGVSLGCTVIVQGLSESPTTIRFTLSLKDQQLESAFTMFCLASRRFADPESSDDVINRFLTTLRHTLGTHDSSEIGKIFDDNFLFKGCHGTYTKAQALQMIGKMSSELSFQLKSSAWNTNGQIEYTVTVSGYKDDFDAQFVFCPFRNVLKSGMIPGCPARRRFY